MNNDPFQMQRELRYGAPVCDQILTGRYFTVGYSWYFRQAKWVLEVVNPNDHLMVDTERKNKFRADLRIPHRFRAGLGHFKGSGLIVDIWRLALIKTHLKCKIVRPFYSQTCHRKLLSLIKGNGGN